MIDLWPMASSASKAVGGMMPKIVEGIVIGVAAGIVLQIINYGTHRLHQRSQINHLRMLLEEGREAIYGAQAIQHPKTPDQLISVHPIRWALYENFRLDVFSTLRERCANMNYDQIAAVRKAFRSLEIPVEKMKQMKKARQAEESEDVETSEDVFPPLELYERLFKTLEDMKWLKLSIKRPAPSAYATP